MTSESQRSDESELQFDRVQDAAAAGGGEAVAVTCSTCQAVLTREYYSLDGAPVCAHCKDAALTTQAEGTRKRRFPKAMMFGLVAAILGAVLYYGVIAITDFEIGIVAIACGYMVGWAVHRGASGFGGRRYQVLAAALTYFSVGLAYMPLAIKGFRQGNMEATSDSSRRVDTTAALAGMPARNADTAGPAAAAGPSSIARSDSLFADSVVTEAEGGSEAKQISPLYLLLGLGAVILLPFAMPVIAVFSSLPGGLISAFIIAIGMHQAWQMTALSSPVVSGPFAVGTRAGGV